jgi:hypothetical protein
VISFSCLVHIFVVRYPLSCEVKFCGTGFGRHRFGIVCSSWVFMSRSVYGRDMVHPEGFHFSQGARHANCMLSRVVLMYRIAISRGLIVVLEQPSSSVMVHHRRFQQLIRAVPIYRSDHCLGQFYGDSRKPIMLLSNVPCFAAVNEFIARHWIPASEGVYRPHIDLHGNRRTTGLQGLKETQSYPRAFGRAVARVYCNYCRENPPSGASASTPIDLPSVSSVCDDQWDDVEASGTIAVLCELVRASDGFE